MHLQQLHAHISAARRLSHDRNEIGEHLLLKKEVEDAAIVLIAPDEDLGDRPQSFHNQQSIARRHIL